MEKNTVYRGYSGEVIVGLFSLKTLLSLVPIFIFYFITFFLVGLVSDSLNLPFLPAICFPFILAFVVGRFALSSREGELDSGFFSKTFTEGEAFAFSGRYVATILLVSLPQYLVAFLIYRSLINLASHMSEIGMYSIFTPVQFGIVATSILGLFVVLVLTPALCALFVTCTLCFNDILRLDIWTWLFIEKRKDLLIFFTSLAGGMGLFVCLFSFPLLFISSWLATASPSSAVFVLYLSPIVPACIFPILLGRLSGSFVLAGGELSTDQGQVESEEVKPEEPKVEAIVPEEKAESEVLENDSKGGSEDEKPEEVDPLAGFDPSTTLITEIPGRPKTSFVKMEIEESDDIFAPKTKDSRPQPEIDEAPESKTLDSGATSNLEPGSITPLSVAPPETLIMWIQGSFPKLPTIERAHLFRKGDEGGKLILSLGVTLADGVHFRQQQELLRVLGEELSNQEISPQVILVNEYNAEQVLECGMLVYQG